MARSAVRSANADPHERAENRLLRKMASLHKEKIVARKPHESKREERMAGRKGAKAEPKKAKAKGGRDAAKKEHHKKAEHRKEERKEHPGGAASHASEHKMAEVHVHHHHHHHHGGKK
jgi:hypothetical protein